jgi:hypothetical protein
LDAAVLGHNNHPGNSTTRATTRNTPNSHQLADHTRNLRILRRTKSEQKVKSRAYPDYLGFELGERIALAITHAMRDDMIPLRGVISDLRHVEGWDDIKIGETFMEVGRLVFNEEESKEIGAEE